MRFRIHSPRRLHEAISPYLEEELDEQLEVYDDLITKRERLQAKIEAMFKDELAEIERIDKETASMSKRFQKSMAIFGKACIKSDKWIMSLKRALPKRVAPSYKLLWQTALGKLNEKTRNVLLDLERAHIEMKAKTPKETFDISRIEENIFKNLFKWVVNKLKMLISKIKGYSSFVDTLPKI